MASLYLSFSATREFHAEYEPFNHPFSLVQITVKTARTLFSLLQLEVSLEHRLVVGGELFHGGGGTLGLFGWGCASGTLEPLAYTYTRAAQPSRHHITCTHFHPRSSLYTIFPPFSNDQQIKLDTR